METEERQKNRERILTGARELFRSEGYHETTMEALAASFGCTKPFVYYHFASKEEIVARLIHDDATSDPFTLPYEVCARTYGVVGRTWRKVAQIISAHTDQEET